MTKAVRYFSKLGNTKTIAEAIAEGLSKEQVGKVILFTTSNWSRRTVLALRKLLNAKGISVENEYFYAHMLHIKGRVHAAYEFGKRSLSGEGETV